jgi:hypothetical protein
VLVSFNSVMQIILYAPLYMLYVNVSHAPTSLPADLLGWELACMRKGLAGVEACSKEERCAVLCPLPCSCAAARRHPHPSSPQRSPHPIIPPTPSPTPCPAPPRPHPALQTIGGSDSATIGFWPVARSVLIFLGVPLVAGILLRITVILIAGRWWFENK